MAGEDGQEGVAAAVALAIRRAGQPLELPSALQLPLLPPAEGEAESEAEAGEGAEKRGPGRPAGSRNKRTDEIVAYLERRYRSPLEALAGIYSRNIKVLAAELGNSAPTFDQLVELMRLQIVAARELAPYLHQKRPVAVEVSSKGVVQLVIERSGEALPGPSGMAGERVLDLVAFEEENQDKSND